MNFIIKPTSFLCNMACKYCFYLEKADFMSKKNDITPFMQTKNLYQFMEKRISYCQDKNITFIWQGGEPLLIGIDFYKRAVEYGKILAKKFNKNIYHSIQTNGTLINDEWAKFFHDEKILIGLSIDGDEELHDVYRKMKNNHSSFSSVLNAIKLMQHYQVEFNTLTVVNNINVKYPLRIYKFLKSLNIHFMQFIPVVEMDKNTNINYMPSWMEHNNVNLAEFSVNTLEYGNFINTIFDEWIRHDIANISIRLFDTLLQHFTGQPSSLCIFMPQCGGENMVLEADGTIYQCDHFVYPYSKYKLGNILDLDQNQLQSSINNWSKYKQHLSLECKQCSWLPLCNGGCPKHRFIQSNLNEKEYKSYFCPAYKSIFEHITPGMNLILEFMERKIPWEYLSSAVDKMYNKNS